MAKDEARIKQYFLARLEGAWAEWQDAFAAEPEAVRARLEALWSVRDDDYGLLAGPFLGEPEPDAELAPGTLLGGRYEIFEPLGAGSFARVYRARDRRVASKETAVKVFHSGLLTEALLQPEVRAMARVNHPGIMRVTDVGETADGRSYLVRDYFGGETLRERMARGAVGKREGLEIVRQIAEALETAHAQGLIHCDLKPENVLINAAGRVALIDFGLADLFDGQARTVLVSSNFYAAPELQEGRRPEAAADIYSLGRIWAEMGGTGRLTAWMQERRPEARPAGAGAVLAAMGRERGWRRAGWVAVATLLAIGAGAAGMRMAMPRGAAVIPALLPVTAFPGAESQPALTPDGREVYFTWKGEDEKTTRIHRIPVGGGTPAAVTEPDDEVRLPAVSPDGRRLAYLRFVPGTNEMRIRWMELAGGTTKTMDLRWPVWMDWMPDGRRLLVGRNGNGEEGSYELGLLDVESGTWEVVGQDDGRSRIRLSVARDGRRVAYQVQEKGGPSRAVVGELVNGRLRDREWSNEFQEMQRPAWAADGQHILFLAGRQNNRQVHVARWDRLREATVLPGFGQKLDYLAVARERNVAVVAQSQEDQNVWRLDLAGEGGPVTGSGRIAETTWDDEEPAIAEAAGKVLYVSDQSGSEQIWESSYDGRAARRLTEYEDGHQLRVLGLAGRREAVVTGWFGKEEGYHVLGLGGEMVRRPGRLIPGRAVGVGRDGASVFVKRGGMVRRMGLDGADRGLMRAGDIHRMEEAVGGQELWYTFKFFSAPWRGGVAHGDPLFRRAFVAGRRGNYFVSDQRRRTLQYREHGSGAVRELMNLPGPVGYGMALRGDERMLVVAVMERTGVDLLAVQDFRLK